MMFTFVNANARSYQMLLKSVAGSEATLLVRLICVYCYFFLQQESERVYSAARS